MRIYEQGTQVIIAPNDGNDGMIAVPKGIAIIVVQDGRIRVVNNQNGSDLTAAIKFRS